MIGERTDDEPLEDKVRRLESLVEVLRQELINQNKKIIRQAALIEGLRLLIVTAPKDE